MPVIASIIGGVLGIAGSAMSSSGGDSTTTVENQPANFSWDYYSPYAQQASASLYNSLFGTPATQTPIYGTPSYGAGGAVMPIEQWVLSQIPDIQSYTPEQVNQILSSLQYMIQVPSTQQVYQQYVQSAIASGAPTYNQAPITGYTTTPAVPSTTQQIVNDAGQYYNQFQEQLPTYLAPGNEYINEQLPQYLSEFDAYLAQTPEAGWQLTQEQLDKQLQEQRLQNAQFAAQYGTSGVNTDIYQNTTNDYMTMLAEQNRLYNQTFAENQMNAALQAAGLAQTGATVGYNQAQMAMLSPQMANQYAQLSFIPYNMQQAYLNGQMGFGSQGGTQTTTSPYIASNPLTSATQGAAMGGYIYNQYPQTPTTVTTTGIPTTNVSPYTYPTSSYIYDPYTNYLA